MNPDSDNNPGLTVFMDEHQARVERALQQRLPRDTIHPAELHEAMRYAVLNGGKRMRPLLVYASGHVVGANPEALDYPACAVELIHAYSLIHDDLPAMDDDDLRRGTPSCHRAYGEAQAILAGDALQALAFQVLARTPEHLFVPAISLRMVELLAQAAGSRGMVGGQAIDLAAVGQELNIAQLDDMHIHKTGAMIRASVRLGVLCAKTSRPDDMDRLDRFGKQIGLAFQIRDDVLNVTGSTQHLGKTTGSDRALKKPTYPAVLGVDAAAERTRDLHREALATLATFGSEADPLRRLCSYIVERNH
ncbi:MAG: farnesyl diphosphate synthase [Gammaproteobacteria bacterium]